MIQDSKLVLEIWVVHYSSLYTISCKKIIRFLQFKNLGILQKEEELQFFVVDQRESRAFSFVVPLLSHIESRE